MDNAIRDFMSRVVPWPKGDETGFVNIHWTRPNLRNPAGKPTWSGKPVRSLVDFMSNVEWGTKQSTVKDIYFCLSTQRQAKQTARGYLTPVRSQDEAIAIKAIWLDVDVKEPPKGYANLIEALDAVEALVKKYKLPSPSAMVGSGGGLHVYWISDRQLSIEEWKPFAEGLKQAGLACGLRFDAGLTTDYARVLRVPGTVNHKTTPTNPVTLLGYTKEYDFVSDLAMFASTVPVGPSSATTPRGAGGLPTLYMDPAMQGQKPAQAFSVLDHKESLALGIGREEMAPLDWFSIATECSFIRDALTTGGKDYSQPMWNLTTLAATFMEDGNDIAHKMGSEHPGYTKDSTEALWDRKNRERRDRGLGWPSCNAIRDAGWTKCSACKHFSKGKSPLNLAVQAAPQVAPVTVAVTNGILTVANGPADPLRLPEGYTTNGGGYICKVVEIEGHGEQPFSKEILQLFNCRLSDPWAQKNPRALNFKTSLDIGSQDEPVSIPHEVLLGGPGMWEELLRQGVLHYPEHKRHMEGFLVAWLTKLYNEIASLDAVPFGWFDIRSDGLAHGFAYGGIIMKDDGTSSPSGFGDATVRNLYKPIGEKQAWLDACKTVTDRKRPELDVIVASAFAAPLFVSTSEKSGLLSPWGASGSGKSSSLAVAQAVWSHPKKTKEVTMSTARSVLHRMGQIKHLPVYWDEIKDEEDQKAVFNAGFAATLGIGPNRLNSNIEMRPDRGDWQTILMICSNLSFVDYIVKRQKTTNAGLYRVFEYEIKKRPGGSVGDLDSMNAGRIIQKLEHNYGVVGMEYAKILASDPKAVDAFTLATCQAFKAKVNHQNEERYWASLCGTLLAGAHYANQLGAQLDIVAMEDFLVKSYLHQRVRLTDAAVEGGTIMNTESNLTAFLKAFTANTLYTEGVAMGAGKPRAIRVIHGPPLDHPKEIVIHYSIQDKVLRISRDKFTAWLKENNIAAFPIVSGLKEFFNAKTDLYATMAAGTPWAAGGQEKLIQIPLPPGAPLEYLLFLHSTNGEGAKPPEPVSTGIVAQALIDQANADVALAGGTVK